MSILLESLNQSKDEKNGDVPSVTDSHFEDEMLSDEWLLKKLKIWRLISVCLLICILISSSLFYYFIVTSENKIAKLNQQLEQSLVKNETLLASRSKVDLTQENNKNSQGKLVQPRSETTPIEVRVPEIENLPTQKIQYQPKKQVISEVVTPQNTGDTISSGSTNQQTAPSDSHQTIVPGKPREFESLSEAEKAELPDLEIASYAVSSNPQKSFVVLNGSFYGQGEIIAPHLVLVSINKEGIVIRYKERFISKKYSLQ